LVIEGRPTENELLEAWNQILTENEKDTGVLLLSDFLRKSSRSALETIKQLRLVLAYHLILYQDSKGIEIAKECNVNIENFGLDSLTAIRTRLQQIATNEEIRSIKRPSKQETLKSFEDIMEEAAYILGVAYLDYEMTVKTWNAKAKIIRNIIKAREKHVNS
jgi:hypothetical protein